MKWLYKLERKFGRYYIPNLMLIIVMGSLGVYLLDMTVMPNLKYQLMLVPSLVLKGQIWRLFTFVFVAESGGTFFTIINLYFMYLIGMNLENIWGGFKFNVYFFISYILTVIVSMITGFPAMELGISISLELGISISLFFAYAKLYPDVEFLLFFILPIKAKILFYINWAIIILNSIKYLMNGMPLGVLLTLVPVANYLIFFGPSSLKETKQRKNNVIRMKDYQKKINSTKKNYIHKCTTCGITDVDDPDMDFRYCGECDGKHAYCTKHIKNHVHIKNK